MKPFIKSGKNHFQKITSHIDMSKPVKVYKNLHKKCWSIKQDRVICHTDFICLKQAIFKVHEAGRLRVLREKKKNVHAYVLGFVFPGLEAPYHEDYRWEPVFYNPYKSDKFHLYNGIKVDKAGYVDMMFASATPVLAYYPE